MKQNFVPILFLGLPIIFYTGCGGSGGGSSSPVVETFKTYSVKVVDDAIIGAKVEAKGCKNIKSIGRGKYTFDCSTPPKYIMAKGGFVDVNDNGKQDKNEIGMGLPLLVNLDNKIVDTNLSDIAVTPLSTLVANITDKNELKKLAKKLNINIQDFNKDISSSHSELFQKLNSLLIIANNNGINNQLLLMKKLREAINKSSATNLNDILTSSLESLKNDKELKSAFGELFISGFIDESNSLLSSNDVLSALANEYNPSDDSKVFITGFIYDGIIKNARIVILDGKVEVGTATSTAGGRWKIAIAKTVLAKDKVLLFKGSAIDENGDKILLKSAITTKYLRGIAKQRISVTDAIDLVISNVTTAQVAILDKNDKNFAKKPKELEENKNRIEIFQQDVLLKASAVIKAIIDGDAKIQAKEDTYSFIVDNLIVVDKKNSQVTLNVDGKISASEIGKQSIAIKKDAILSQQLFKIESERPLQPLLEKSLYSVEYTGTASSAIKKYKKIVISNSQVKETLYKLASDGKKWSKQSETIYQGKIISNVFYFDGDSKIAPSAISLKNQNTVYSVENNKNYTFDVLGQQLYRPFKDRDISKIATTLYSESFDVVTLFKEAKDSKITHALGVDYFKLTEEEQHLAVNRYLIAKISEVPKPFNRSQTKLDSAISVLENTDFETDDVGTKLDEVKTTLNSADSNDKDAQVGKALFALAEVTNSPTVGGLIELTLDGKSVTTHDNLPSILTGGEGKELELELLESISDLSGTSMSVLHDIVLKLEEIDKSLSVNFADETYTFSYDDFDLTNNQSKLIRSSILGVASKLEYLTAFNYFTLEDVKTRTTTLGSVSAEYMNLSSNPLSIFKRSDVGSLNSSIGQVRLTHAKELLLKSIDILDTVVASRESDAENRDAILDAQKEGAKLKASLTGLALYLITDENDNNREVTTYVDLSALYKASSTLDLTHTIGHDFKYDNRDVGYFYTNGKSYSRVGNYDSSFSKFYNEAMAKEWIAEDGTKLSYVDDGSMPRPNLDLKTNTVPTGTNSHIPTVIKKIKITESGLPTLTHTGDNVLKYLYNGIDVDRNSNGHYFTKSEDINFEYRVESLQIPDSSIRYSVDFLYGANIFEFQDADPVKGEVRVVGKSGFTGNQCFGVLVRDTLGHRENINECIYIEEGSAVGGGSLLPKTEQGDN